MIYENWSRHNMLTFPQPLRLSVVSDLAESRTLTSIKVQKAKLKEFNECRWDLGEVHNA